MYSWPLHGHKALLPPTGCILVLIQVGLSAQKQKPYVLVVWGAICLGTPTLYLQVRLSQMQQFAGRGAHGPAGAANTHSQLLWRCSVLMASAGRVSRVGRAVVSFPGCSAEAGQRRKWCLIIHPQRFLDVSLYAYFVISVCLSLTLAHQLHTAAGAAVEDQQSPGVCRCCTSESVLRSAVSPVLFPYA